METVEQSGWRVKLHEYVKQVIELQLEREKKSPLGEGGVPWTKRSPRETMSTCKTEDRKGEHDSFWQNPGL